MAKKDFNAAAQKATAGFFTNSNAGETNKSIQDSSTGADLLMKPEKKIKVEKKGFSFRGNPEDVQRWQNYGMAVKNTHAPSEKFRVDEIWCAAIEEYIKAHPLSGKAKDLFDGYMGN